ncbi:polysaccharide export protein [Thozetella sp. PMI_491]|nr:polysaccharide export protein [Thozetella sp. PMI_491]
MLITSRAFRRLRGPLRWLRARRQVILFAMALFVLFDTILLVCGRPETSRPPLMTLGQWERSAKTTVFIVSVHRNTEDMLRGTWNDAVVHLVSALGPENIHFSAIESGSQDHTKEALTELKARLDALNVSNTIALGMTMWEQIDELGRRPDPSGDRKEGWIWNAAFGQYDLRRIPYLSKVRNQALEPLQSLASEGRRFDKILWLNDVVFDTEDVLNLLETRDGEYAAACSLDFKTYPYYYDTFALRDDQGQKTSSSYFPWFISTAARASVYRAKPVKVFSCWNGMVSFDSSPFYAKDPLKFRGVPDTLADYHLEASECCLIHADNPLSRQPGKGVWLNPNVRVGYNTAAYSKVKGGKFPGAIDAFVGVWINRARRVKVAVQLWLEGWTVQSRLGIWRSQGRAEEAMRTEPGEPCLINEMQVMWENGWKHL